MAHQRADRKKGQVRNNEPRRIINSIAFGELDPFLDEMAAAIRTRIGTASREKLLRLKPGDRVRFNDRVRPKGLRGVDAVVVGINRSTVSVTIDKSVGVFLAGTPISTSPALIDLKEKQ